MLLTRSDNSPMRFYSLTAQILHKKREYYAILQKVQYSNGDITPWIIWYLECFKLSLESTQATIDKTLNKAKFWERHKETPLNERQQQMINRLQDNFVGALTTTKWAKITKCSQDTALRDIQDLISKGVLCKDSKGGRSTGYLVLE